MMRYLKEWDIVFDENNDTYLPGDIVSGKVIINVQNTISVSKIKVRFRGKAEVTMFIGDYDTQRVYYFNYEKILFQCPDKTASVDFLPGHYEYPFYFTLPLGLPYSFSSEGDESGMIVYAVRATIHRPGKYTFVCDKPFKVLGVLDLNSLHDATNETNNSKTKTLKCLIWNMGDILAYIELPKKGFIQGEEIPIHVIVTNRSSRRVKKTVVFLVQRITMTVYGSKSMKNTKICNVQRGPVPPGRTDDWRGDTLRIPDDLPPTSAKGCELIDVQYRLQLVVTPACLCRKLRVPLDIIVGTVPLRSPPASVESEDLIMDSSIFDHGSCV